MSQQFAAADDFALEKGVLTPQHIEDPLSVGVGRGARVSGARATLSPSLLLQTSSPFAMGPHTLWFGSQTRCNPCQDTAAISMRTVVLKHNRSQEILFMLVIISVRLLLVHSYWGCRMPYRSWDGQRALWLCYWVTL